MYISLGATIAEAPTKTLGESGLLNGEAQYGKMIKFYRMNKTVQREKQQQHCRDVDRGRGALNTCQGGVVWRGVVGWVDPSNSLTVRRLATRVWPAGSHLGPPCNWTRRPPMNYFPFGCSVLYGGGGSREINE